ncbi:MAG: tRNA uridine-5-carboxymethylaminomethyl(34) synthesis GTPase MnmE [Bacilli bacterium]|nr:tRNA uridine-5-carboxymethylaminomethyl(34) synthesis GTPase MnmE [Bacilli bacterium]
MDDTIAAISTAIGVGAISIIRVSGKDSIDIVNKIFDRDIKEFKTNTINYGHIVYEGKIIDEVLLSIFLAPKTYTTEDIVEINSHGGIPVTNKILEILLETGARLAEPGEFTKRAFLNGRIDLLEAESIMDMINAKTESARKMAINGINGNLSKKINRLRDKALDLISNIEVNIDYPEYEDIEVMTIDDIKKFSKTLNDEINVFLKDSESGKLIKEGINTVILGRPNVGKSSILNKLLDEEKAIVTDIPGTTRDVVEGSIRINGVLINFLDTAGVRKTDNTVEKIGVEKSLSLLDDADLVLLVLNNNEKLTRDDELLLEKTKNKKRIIVINKIDLDNKLDISNLDNVVRISAQNNEIEELINKINELFNLEEINNGDLTYLSNAREISLLKKAKKSSDNLLKSLEDGIPIDMLELDIKNIIDLLGEITGDSYEDELIDRLFSNFCLGK